MFQGYTAKYARLLAGSPGTCLDYCTGYNSTCICIYITGEHTKTTKNNNKNIGPNANYKLMTRSHARIESHKLHCTFIAVVQSHVVHSFTDLI